MDIKMLLKYVESLEPERVFDLGIGAYLLNPLKSSYTYEDIAREYIGGISIPSREELLGKETYEKPGKNLPKIWESVPVIRRLLPMLPGRKQRQSLRKQECGRFIRTLNFLLYLLWIPWKMRNLRKGEELKAYGERLSVRIRELES